jgi:hypothetical protein
MTRAELEVIYRRRDQLLRHARELARTGGYANHQSILSQLEGLEGFADARSRLDERAFRVQLDRLCAIAQGRTI